MKQTGDLLRQARENAKLSLSEVALSTKINPKILAAIENGDNTNLPAKTFLKGFVRSYALFLKMDADEVMKVFHQETGGTPPPVIDKEVIRQTQEAAAPDKPSPAIKQRRVGDDESFSGLRAIAVTVIVILIGVIIGVRELVEKYQREKVVDAATELKVSPLAENDKKTNAKKESKAEAKTGTPAADKVVAETPRMLRAPPEAPKKEEPKAEEAEKKEPAVAEAKPAEVKSVEAKPAEMKSAEVKPAEVKPPTPEAKPPQPAPASTTAATPAPATPPQSALKSVKNEIILEALDKVEVKFKVNGQAKILSLGPTQVHTIFADQPMVLDLSDGGAVNIILNGRERGVPGDLGKPKQVTIP